MATMPIAPKAAHLSLKDQIRALRHGFYAEWMVDPDTIYLGRSEYMTLRQYPPQHWGFNTVPGEEYWEGMRVWEVDQASHLAVVRVGPKFPGGFR
jgi:hypothetical protein